MPINLSPTHLARLEAEARDAAEANLAPGHKGALLRFAEATRDLRLLVECRFDPVDLPRLLRIPMDCR